VRLTAHLGLYKPDNVPILRTVKGLPDARNSLVHHDLTHRTAVTDTANPPESATGLFLARQPILDATGKLHGYELLNRSDETGGADIAAGDE
jgi:hypothetical protein